MLAGDFEHNREIPVRPRVIYDRIHDRVSGDAYSRLLAVAAGGTIPDKGLFLAKTEEGVTLGELDEEFVYETQIGDKIVLGAFAWRILRQDRDTVFVAPTSTDGARLPFWKGEIKGRSLKTSLEFGKMSRRLMRGMEEGTILADLAQLGLNHLAADSAADFLKRQLAATGVLPDDRTIVVEHFTDHTNCHQIMVHALFGKRVNAPLSMLMQQAASQILKVNLGCVDEEDGFLLYPYGEEILPEGLLYAIAPKGARRLLEAILPLTPVFSMTFRYNAARALMMGMKNQGRQPLWLQRLKSTEMLDSLISQEQDHPLIRETRRECLEDLWDIEGVLSILNGIQSGVIAVREVYTEVPSPMSLPLQWQVEAAEMYSYTPTTSGLQQSVNDQLNALTQMDQIKPGEEELKQQSRRKKIPEDMEQLHSLLMIEGDLLAEELVELNMPSARSFIEQLIARDIVAYIEPGLWIAAEHRDQYAIALGDSYTDGEMTTSCQKSNYNKQDGKKEALAHIIRRMLYYRGAMSPEQISERYFLPIEIICEVVDHLREHNEIICDEGVYFHAKHYSRARTATIRNLRAQIKTCPGTAYAAIMAAVVSQNATADEQLELTIRRYCGQAFPVAWWETVILSRRVKGYRENMLDCLLAKGEYYWRFTATGDLCFERYEEIDWDQPIPSPQEDWSPDELLIYQELIKRGASFMRAFNNLPLTGNAQESLLSLAKRGYIYADSFLPVRQLMNWDKIKKASPRARVNARVMALSAGRWDVVRPRKEIKIEAWLEQLFDRQIILCRETYIRPELDGQKDNNQPDMGWGQALSILRIWEVTGRVRRGYFVAGMSGAQFIRAQDYEGVTLALKRPTTDITWLNTVDPAQIWGKALGDKEGKDFINLPGTLVALQGGRPVMVLERQGKILRLLEHPDSAAIIEKDILAAITELTLLYKQKKLLPDKKRLVIKDYPTIAESALKTAGFHKEMMDYVFYI
jgi:ATP-dependent Lhr-like helicase